MSDFFWRIPRRSFCCSRGEESLQKQTEYFSVLLPHKKEVVVRKDFCSPCWDSGAVLENYPDHMAHWHVVKHQRPVVFPQSEKIERAIEQLQISLEESTIESFQRAFMMAQYCVRHRRFVLRRSGHTLEEAVYEDLLTQAIYHIPFVPLESKEKGEWIARLEKEINGHR